MTRDYEEYLKDDNLHINWYPGHMKKTKEMVQNNLKLVDVVIELLDARIPLSSKNPEIDKLAHNKPRVVVLNKSDLSDRAKLNKWISYYLRVMIVGVPNVGKSSLINKLTGRKSTQTGDRPGVTKGKQWVRLKGNLELLDTPGILWPKFEDQKIALNLAFTRAIKDEILDIDTLGLKFIEKMSEIEPEKLKARYKLDSLGEEPLETMEMIGRKRGFILGRNELDYTRIAKTVLNEFREGKLGQITLEVPEDIEEA